MRGSIILLVTALLVVAWLGLANAGVFPNGPHPAVPKSLADITQSTKLPQKRVVEDQNNKPLRNTWVVEFNDLITSSPEEFAQQHAVHVHRIGDTNKYSVRQKHATDGLDAEKQSLLSSDPRVHSIEFQQPQRRFVRQIPTTDPGLCEQWHLYQCPTSTRPTASINVSPAWKKNFTGNGVQVAIVDDGAEITHPDLAAAYVADDSYDFINDDSNPSADPSTDYHGTSCTGLAVAQTNSHCGVGVAYKATFAALRLISAAATTDAQEASALAYNSDNNHIYSNSWGPEDDGMTMEAPGALARNSMASTSGRGGKGNIFVWAGGNGRQKQDQTTKDGYASHPNVICVSATGRTGRYASYSEPGASVFVAAPGGDTDDLIYTTDLTGSNGYSSSECTDIFSGTSAATPIVSGAVALILEANPELTNRDVRRILGLTTAKNDMNNTMWFKNGANHWINYNYGFGLVDADKAVEAAKMWTTLPDRSVVPAATVLVNEEIAAEKCYALDYTFNVTIEYLELYINMVHPFRGDITIKVQSPSGTNVTVLFATNDSNDDIKWSFYTYFFMDEYSQGTWQICLEDVSIDDDTGILSGYSFTVIGREPEDFVTTATLDSTSQPAYLDDLVNVTVTFSDDEGIFAASISPSVISVGDEVPIAVEIVASTSTSITAVFTVDTSLPSYTAGSFDIRTTDVSVQNKWLKYMSGGVLLGTLTLDERPPVVAPVTSGPGSNTPSSGTPFNNVPVKTPTGRVSGATSVAVPIMVALGTMAAIVA